MGSHLEIDSNLAPEFYNRLGCARCGTMKVYVQEPDFLQKSSRYSNSKNKIGKVEFGAGKDLNQIFFLG